MSLNLKPERRAHMWHQSQLKNVSQNRMFFMYPRVSNLLSAIFELQNINIQSILIRHNLNYSKLCKKDVSLSS
jgi:hypothetical protein